MPNTKIARFSDLLRLIRRGAAATHGVRGGRVVAGSVAALHRVDAWTLVAFNPGTRARPTTAEPSSLGLVSETKAAFVRSVLANAAFARSWRDQWCMGGRSVSTA